MTRYDEATPHRIASVEVPSTGGRIAITPCPGTPIFPSPREDWFPNLVADLDAIRAWGAVAVVTLIRAGEPTAPHLTDLQQEVEARGIEWHHAPIDDGDIPDAEFEALWRHVGPRLRAPARGARREPVSGHRSRPPRTTRGHWRTQQRLYVQACRPLTD